MLFKETVLKVLDNSNILNAKIMGLYNNKIAYVTAVVLICRKKVRVHLSKKKYLFIITQSRLGKIRRNGFKIWSDYNAGYVLDDTRLLLATKYSGPVFKELEFSTFGQSMLFFRVFV